MKGEKQTIKLNVAMLFAMLFQSHFNETVVDES